MKGNDGVLKENRALKEQIDKLERENRDLKKSVYDLNVRSGHESHICF